MVRNLDTSSKPIEKASGIYMQQGKANQPKQNTTTGKGKLKKQENHPWLYTASTDVAVGPAKTEKKIKGIPKKKRATTNTSLSHSRLRLARWESALLFAPFLRRLGKHLLDDL